MQEDCDQLEMLREKKCVMSFQDCVHYCGIEKKKCDAHYTVLLVVTQNTMSTGETGVSEYGC